MATAQQDGEEKTTITDRIHKQVLLYRDTIETDPMLKVRILDSAVIDYANSHPSKAELEFGTYGIELQRGSDDPKSSEFNN